ncbi:MAG TPA: biotin/lipoyl-binding protein, partial [Burkholderiaceae bacterium]|nr:biotin/lipoyl-binding protein [Burkholderiaceae bacterium]
MTAIWHLFAYGPKVAQNSNVIFRPEHWLTMALLWLALKLGHEFFHALACKKYGGNVNRAGVMVILLAPVAFVDVTSSWRFPSKWQRIITAAAGMYFELCVAAIGVIVWCHTRDGWVHRLAGEASIIAGIGTLLFNANPLMRFDGYFVLSDLLGIPNLYSHGRQYLTNAIEKCAFGIKSPALPVPPGKLKWVGCYGLAAFLWRLFVLVSLSIAAIGLLSYAGAVVAAALAWVWFLQPALMRLRRVLTDTAVRPNPKRVLVAGCAVGAVLMSAMLAASRPTVVQVPAVVEYSPLSVVRTTSPGFVEQVLVRSGDLVEQGQVIATLRNDDLQLELGELQLAREQSLVYGRIHAQAGDVAKG